jgi:hypothetical protein
MARADDSTIPVAHHDIVAIFKPIRARPITDAFLALLQLFK